MTGTNIVTVLSRSLNMLDYRIVDHGQRVAYIMHHMLMNDARYSDNDRGRIMLLCELHDIGAFKTEDIDTLAKDNIAMKFESKNTIKHSAYGYLFLKTFSILNELADAVLFHHFRYDDIQKSDCVNKDIAAKLLFADKMDFFINFGNVKISRELLSGYRDRIFSAADIDRFLELDERFGISEKLRDGNYLEELLEIHNNIALNEEELLSFLKTLGFFIDFRSEFTVLHNISTVGFSMEIAKLMGLSRDEQEKIYYGSTLHDVGKIGTSIMVLEKSEKLDDFEYNMIKDHIIASEVILKGCVDEDILQIAIRHHEKLDGSGYSRGLTGADLTTPQRIVCVADILSALYGKRSYKNPFPAEKIIGILQNMAEKGQLSKEIVAVVAENYTDIISRMDEKSHDTIERYKKMQDDYVEICSRYENTYGGILN